MHNASFNESQENESQEMQNTLYGFPATGKAHG